MRRLRIASVGAGSEAGSRTWAYLNVINALPDMYELSAICDHSAERAQAAADAYGCSTIHTDLDVMLAEDKPDVVLRMAPTDSCVGISVRAAEAGCHVLTEIPIAPTLPMADRIIDACRANGVKLEVAENVFLWPQELLKRKVVEAGLLGKIVHTRLTYPCGTYHGMNAIRMVTGRDPVRVLGYAGKVEIEGKLSCGGDPMPWAYWEGATLDFGDFKCLYELPPKNRAWRRHWDVEGTRGYLEADDLHLYEGDEEKRYAIERTEDGDGVLQRLHVETDPVIEWQNPYARYGISDMDDIAKAALLESMYRMVVDDAAPVYGAENARKDQEIAVALRESDLRGNVWMDLPLTEVTGLEERIHAAFREKYGCDPVDDIDGQLKATYDRSAVMWNEVGWL